MSGGTAVSEGHYDKAQAEGYAEAKSVDFRNRVELYSTLNFVGPVNGKRVIDIACGSGWLTRHLRDCGAAYVMGTDMSPYFVDMARKQEEEEAKYGVVKIDYEVEDAREPKYGNGTFDVVTSNWLLVNAKNQKEVAEMCQGLAAKLRPGGKLVTVVNHPDLYSYPDNEEINATMKPYGVNFVLPTGELEDGATMKIQLFTPTGELAVELENYYHSKELMCEELEKAGFTDIIVHDKMMLSPEKDDADDWKEFFKYSLFMGIIATKRADDEAGEKVAKKQKNAATSSA